MAGKNFKWTMAHRTLILDLLPYKYMSEIAELIGVDRLKMNNWMNKQGISELKMGFGLKIKTCPNCKKEFKPSKTNKQIYCGYSCSNSCNKDKRPTPTKA